jgi:hypothetical protein
MNENENNEEVEYVRCGAERPRMEFDTCCLPIDHGGDFHEDEDGNTWSINFHDWASSW